MPEGIIESQSDKTSLDLRKQIKHRLIDLDLDRPGTYDVVLPMINDKLKDRKTPVSKNILYMAMTGFRYGTSYVEVLQAFAEVLNEMPLRAA